jgi:excisionase family DNA binding protein
MLNRSVIHEEQLVSIDYGRRQLGQISRVTVERLIKAGAIESAKVGRRRMLVAESLQAYIDKCISTGRMKQGQ